MLKTTLLAIAILVYSTASSFAQDHTYDVSGSSDEGDVSGSVDSWNGQREVQATIINENGEEKTFEGPVDRLWSNRRL